MTTVNTNYNKIQYRLLNRCEIVALENRQFLTIFKTGDYTLPIPVLVAAASSSSSRPEQTIIAKDNDDDDDNRDHRRSSSVDFICVKRNAVLLLGGGGSDDGRRSRLKTDCKNSKTLISNFLIFVTVNSTSKMYRIRLRKSVSDRHVQVKHVRRDVCRGGTK